MGIRLTPAKSGDIGDVRIVQLGQRVDGSTVIEPFPLTQAASGRALVRCGRHPVGTLAIVFADPENGIIEVQLGDANGWLKTATPGTWQIEYEITFNDGSVITWPNDDYDTIEVVAGLG